MSEYLRWVLEPGNLIALKGEPLIVRIKLGNSAQDFAQFALVPRGVGDEVSEIRIHADAIIKKNGKTKAVSSTFVPPKTIFEIYAHVIEFVETFSDDPVCKVLADALREGMQPQHSITPLNREDVEP